MGLNHELGIRQIAERVDLKYLALQHWVNQLQLRRNSGASETAQITLEHYEIPVLKAHISMPTLRKPITKKAGALVT